MILVGKWPTWFDRNWKIIMILNERKHGKCTERHFIIIIWIMVLLESDQHVLIEIEKYNNDFKWKKCMENVHKDILLIQFWIMIFVGKWPKVLIVIKNINNYNNKGNKYIKNVCIGIF